jgi:UDP-N-acetylmuramyl-tripeptide synthetase
MLRELLQDALQEDFEGMADVVVTGVHYDSRQVEPGGIFVAIPGMMLDGQDFIADAIDRGAVAVVGQRATGVPQGVRYIEVDDSRKALARLAATFYGNPSRDLVLVGITGTNGKTTSAYLIEAILTEAGYNVGVIGTINYRYGGNTFENPVTTPESLELMRILREMADNGVTHVVLEVSSHALDLNRVSSCAFDVGVFTNLSQDHLDYHKSMDAYWQAKKRLCTDYLEKGAKSAHAVAVVNRDDPRGKDLVSQVSVSCLAIGLSAPCQIRAENVRTTIEGIAGTIHTPSGPVAFTSPLVGKHNVYNVLTAVGVASAMHVSLSDIEKGIASLHGVPGRLERVWTNMGFSVFVDYAHTPDALENVLIALKELTPGRLITVFGCGGDRDRKKRPLMGAVSARLSDLTILTSDNPRSEDPSKIIQDIEGGVVSENVFKVGKALLGATGNKPGYVVEANRREAIFLGLGCAGKGDTVLIAGKGHETYQIMDKRTLPFDDRVEAKEALAQLTQKQRSTR